MDNADFDLQPLLERFGFDRFRPGQEQAIRALLQRRDVLALFPTGAGKSLVYQLTAHALPGTTVIVSPLIALMQDQVDALAERGLPVSVINSSLSERTAEEALQQVQSGATKLIYVTPERFQNDGFMKELRRTEISLFVVDEAHTVADWGHSFRPAYLALASVITRLGRPPVLALTATANPWMRREIIEQLQMRDPAVIVRGTDRPNLFFEVRRVEQERDDQRELQRLLTESDDAYPPEVGAQLDSAMHGSGIIYAATTRAARETAEWLQAWGIAADYYHGQRKKTDRQRVQDAFMSGELRVIAATNAFGLGIDKPDVRFVIHRDIPGSVEAYYQEAGRAGRDGAFARCTLIYRPGDLGRAVFLSSSGQLTREEVLQAWPGVLANPNATRRELVEATGLNQGDLNRLLATLVREGIMKERRGRFRLVKPETDPATISLEEEQQRLAYERSRFDMMRGYAETSDCRRHYILNYFAEASAEQHCTSCDNDVPRATQQRIEIAAGEQVESSFAPGDKVEHGEWGAGEVQRVAGDAITVLFESNGFKTLATDLVQEHDLLKHRT